MKKKITKYLNEISKVLDDSDSTGALNILYQKIDQLPEPEIVALDNKFSKPLEMSKANQWAVFSDGGCRGNPGPGAWAAMAQDPQGEFIFEITDYAADTTNNRMEMIGVIEGLKQVQSFFKNPALENEVIVYTDSKYIVDGMNSWLAGWKKRGWKKADKKAPENLDLWQSLDQLKDEYARVTFLWVKGHAGHPQNEFCDSLLNRTLDENS